MRTVPADSVGNLLLLLSVTAAYETGHIDSAPRTPSHPQAGVPHPQAGVPHPLKGELFPTKHFLKKRLENGGDVVYNGDKW